MAHAFISYVFEDIVAARHIASVLRHNGVEVYLDKDDLGVGLPWKAQLRKAIETVLSTDPERLSIFTLKQKLTYPAGSAMFNPLTSQVILSHDMTVDSHFTIMANIDRNRVSGNFRCGATFRPAPIEIQMSGDFWFDIQASF